MKKRVFYLTILFFCLTVSSYIPAQKKQTIKWSVAATLPPNAGEKRNKGIAGAFAGVHKDLLFIGGGANFPYAMPWEGGKKVYHNSVFILHKKRANRYVWCKTDCIRLLQPVAYGATVSTDDGIVCLGGENETGILRNVFSVQWGIDKNKIQINELVPLPLPLTNASAVVKDSIIYVAGGETNGHVSDKFIYLNLKDTSAGWKELPPVPVPVSHFVMALQSNGHSSCIYVLGGRKKTASGISELYNTVFEYNLSNDEWRRKEPLPYSLSAGTGLANGTHGILLFGGDKGETFHKVEELLAAINQEKDEMKRQQLILKKNGLQISHPGFSNEVLLYKAEEDKWEIAGTIPFSTPVTAALTEWDKRVVIVSGEIKAGVRTPQILIGKLQKQ